MCAILVRGTRHNGISAQRISLEGVGKLLADNLIVDAPREACSKRCLTHRGVELNLRAHSNGDVITACNGDRRYLQLNHIDTNLLAIRARISRHGKQDVVLANCLAHKRKRRIVADKAAIHPPAVGSALDIIIRWGNNHLAALLHGVDARVAIEVYLWRQRGCNLLVDIARRGDYNHHT